MDTRTPDEESTTNNKKGTIALNPQVVEPSPPPPPICTLGFRGATSNNAKPVKVHTDTNH